ncbi:MAG: 30S ribosomal protein S16 [Anaerolineae bacterium]
MVKIRLRRVGAKKQPSYRIVIASSTSPRDGRFLEVIGHYNPRTEPETVVVDVERARYWLGHGAQPTEAVARMLRKVGAYAAAFVAAAEATAAAPAPVAPVAEAPAAEAAPTVSEA